jgi:SAM-dependent methyltransferase
MTFETSKAYRRRFCREIIYADIFKGRGIDIGGGTDPLCAEWFSTVESIRNFDVTDGDAQNIGDCVKEQFDFVYSSNCLEHLERPVEALVGWWSLVKTGGYLVLIVPDEDLYEQRVWPSRWNGGHRWTFTVWKGISWKGESWSPVSVNVVELWRKLEGAKLVHLRMADSGYDETLRGVDQTMPADGAEAFIELVVRKK